MYNSECENKNRKNINVCSIINVNKAPTGAHVPAFLGYFISLKIILYQK